MSGTIIQGAKGIGIDVVTSDGLPFKFEKYAPPSESDSPRGKSSSLPSSQSAGVHFKWLRRPGLGYELGLHKGTFEVLSGLPRKRSRREKQTGIGIYLSPEGSILSNVVELL